MKWIKQYIDYKGITVYSFEKKIGTRSTIDKAIKTNSKLRSDILAKIIEKFDDIRAEWLLTGEGEMLKETPQKQPVQSSKNWQKEVEIDPRIYEIQDRAAELGLAAFDIYKATGISYETIKNILLNGPRATRSKTLNKVLSYLQEKAGHTGTLELKKEFITIKDQETIKKIEDFSKLSIEEKLNRLYKQSSQQHRKVDLLVKYIDDASTTLKIKKQQEKS